jgi:hypothetical protein
MLFKIVRVDIDKAWNYEIIAPVVSPRRRTSTWFNRFNYPVTN